MHLLPRVLGLLLLAAPCAADDRLEPYFGTWKGTITSSANDCEWTVKLTFRPQGDSRLRGQFTYSGPCAKAPAEGYFNADSGGPGDCLKGMLSMPGFPGMNGEACFNSDGDLAFKAGAMRATLSLSEGGEKADLTAASPQGSAEGSFTKQLPRKAAKGKKVKRTDAKKDKPEKPSSEVLIGGY